ncbi:MAG: acyl-protein synthetase [Candidatus Shapirobacteria bacterium]|jgi:phenylacetate-coenzyme A ligase PaaK-like adenylate-forming protein
MDNREFFKKQPFCLAQSEKEKVFLFEMKRLVKWHYEKCQEFKILCDNRNFSISGDFELEELPYFPVSIFKKFDIMSVPREKIIKILYSSSTSGEPSKIMIDKETADNQSIVVNNILSDFFGKERMHFIIFDNEEVLTSSSHELSSRGTAIRGMISMAKKMSFVLDRELNLDVSKIESIMDEIREGDKVCFFSFTWLIYNIYLNNKDNERVINIFRKLKNQEKNILHIGGWKKLKDIAVSKEKFNENIGNIFNVPKEKIVDFYGMTEQLGTVYPDCEYGYKHIPIYSEIIIRDIDTLKSLNNNQAGFIQFLSPLPHSYPGISILSDDIGEIVGVDDCKCGRKGKYFLFEKRSEKAEVRGCGDSLKI